MMNKNTTTTTETTQHQQKPDDLAEMVQDNGTARKREFNDLWEMIKREQQDTLIQRKRNG